MNESVVSVLGDYDPITELYRRDVVFTKLDQLLVDEISNPPAVLLIEIHRFKQINDGIGPEIGDRLIKGFAKRLKRTAPAASIVGRMGGDGFAVILPAQAVMDETIERILEVTRRPFSIAGNVFVVSASIGVSLAPEHGTAAHELIRAADIALHFTEQGGNDVLTFKPDMLTNAESLHLLENDLRYSIVLEKPDLIGAVTTDQFEVYYQPQVSAQTGRPVGVEALMRWRHPERGYVSPEVFIPLAEEIGVIDLLGAWIMKKACKDIFTIQQTTDFKDFTLSVNVSPKQLEDPTSFLKQIDLALADSQLDPSALMLEITETTIFQTKASEINEIARRGCLLALDDFGTGYSSMNVLRSFPFKTGKLDKVFVTELFEKDYQYTENDQQMITAFQSMCQALGIQTTIEGVETRAHADYLKTVGCDILQGFYFARPMPFDDLMSYLLAQEVSSNG